MEEGGYTDAELEEMRKAAIRARKCWAVLTWIAAGLMAGWSIYLFWYAGYAGVPTLVLAAGLALAGGAIWRAIPTEPKTDPDLFTTGSCGGCH